MSNETIPDYGDDVPVVDDAEPEDADVDHGIDVVAEPEDDS